MAEGLFSNPTPFTPPTTEDELLSCLRLIRSRRVGVATYFRLIDEYGSAAAALEALPEIASAAGAEQYTPCTAEAAMHEMRRGKAMGARLICHGTEDYPAQLNDLTDPPPLFWARGDVSLLTRPMVAIVGARNASSLGQRMARRMAEGLGAAGYVVVSGMARGIDAAVHAATLKTGTVAVMAGGADVIYPSENSSLAAEIVAHGCLVSEQPPGMEPQARHFPMRNRVISGLASAVVVIEAAARSGSLITARTALDQGREVLAVPGHPLDARATGCNMLIRDGATLVRSADDVLEAIASDMETRPAPAPRAALRQAMQPEAPVRSLREISALHGQILARLGPSPMAEDQLIRDLAMPAGKVATELLTLELEGKILRQAGGLLSRNL